MLPRAAVPWEDTPRPPQEQALSIHKKTCILHSNTCLQTGADHQPTQAKRILTWQDQLQKSSPLFKNILFQLLHPCKRRSGKRRQQRKESNPILFPSVRPSATGWAQKRLIGLDPNLKLTGPFLTRKTTLSHKKETYAHNWKCLDSNRIWSRCLKGSRKRL